MFASGGKVSVEVDVVVNHAGGGRGRKLGQKGCSKEEVRAGCNESCFMIPGVVSSDGMIVFAVRVACYEIGGGGCGCG